MKHLSRGTRAQAGSSRKTILFISHDASRTGAPICLLHLLRWLRENTEYQFEILLRNPGPMHEEFSKYGPVTVFRHNVSIAHLVTQHGLRRGMKKWVRFWLEYGRGLFRYPSTMNAYGLVRHVQRCRPALIYSNTVVNGDLLRILFPLGCPIISHIHELRNIIEHFGQENWSSVSECTGQFIAASPAVKKNLVDNYGVNPNKVAVVYEFVPAKSYTKIDSTNLSLRFELNIGETDFVVCGSGLDEWRKGVDLFIRCAYEVKKQSEQPVVFVWVGGWLSEQARQAHVDLVARLGVEDRVQFTGMVENPLDYFAISDAFALTSREDAFPLVCLEAASLGKPVLCFADAGGMPDFVENDGGFVVPFEDYVTLAERITRLARDKSLCRALGARAMEKVAERHDIGIGAPQVLAIIRSVLKEHGVGGSSLQ